MTETVGNPEQARGMLLESLDVATIKAQVDEGVLGRDTIVDIGGNKYTVEDWVKHQHAVGWQAGEELGPIIAIGKLFGLVLPNRTTPSETIDAERRTFRSRIWAVIRPQLAKLGTWRAHTWESAKAAPGRFSRFSQEHVEAPLGRQALDILKVQRRKLTDDEFQARLATLTDPKWRQGIDWYGFDILVDAFDLTQEQVVALLGFPTSEGQDMGTLLKRRENGKHLALLLKRYPEIAALLERNVQPVFADRRQFERFRSELFARGADRTSLVRAALESNHRLDAYQFSRLTNPATGEHIAFILGRDTDGSDEAGRVLERLVRYCPDLLTQSYSTAHGNELSLLFLLLQDPSTEAGARLVWRLQQSLDQPIPQPVIGARKPVGMVNASGKTLQGSPRWLQNRIDQNPGRPSYLDLCREIQSHLIRSQVE